MSKRLFAGLALTGLVCADLHATPSSMDIGLFAIDNYTGNGGGAADLTYMIASGQTFFWAANANVPAYVASLPATSATSGPTLALDLRNPQVNNVAILSTSTAVGNREFCDFIFYGGHGLAGEIFLGAKPGYRWIIPAYMNLGVGYNRWFMTNSCALFNGPGAPSPYWAPAFKGLKAMLGFKSVVFDNNLSWELYNDFWANWTSREKNLLDSFIDAQTNYGYKHLYPMKGLEPGCLSAQIPADKKTDYCQDTFKSVSHDYNKAIANTGNFYSIVIGTPQY